MALLLKQLISKHLPISTKYVLPSLANVTTKNASTTSNNPDQLVDPDAPRFDMPNPFTKERQQCILCRHSIEVNYKNTKLLSQFQSSYTGRIYGRHITGLCKSQQERVEKEIVKAQSAGLMGVYNKDPHFLKDPQLFDPERPIRPHRF